MRKGGKAESSTSANALRTALADVPVQPLTAENNLIQANHTDYLFFARG